MNALRALEVLRNKNTIQYLHAVKKMEENVIFALPHI